MKNPNEMIETNGKIYLNGWFRTLLTVCAIIFMSVTGFTYVHEIPSIKNSITIMDKETRLREADLLKMTQENRILIAEFKVIGQKVDDMNGRLQILESLMRRSLK